MNVVITFLSLLFLSIVGFSIIKGFNLLPKKSNLFILSLGYGLGAGLVSLQLYLYSRINLPWNAAFVLIPWAVLIFLLILRKKEKIKFSVTAFKKIDSLSLIFIVGIALSWFYTIFEALIRPLATWDGWAVWLIKSKAFYLDKGINVATMRYIASDGPLTVSLLGSFVYLMIGGADDTSVLLASSAYYIFLTILFFSVVRGKYSLKYALFFTFLFATMQTLIRQGGRLEAGQADLPLGYYIFASTILFLEYLKSKKDKSLVLLSIFLAITTLTKFEGLPFALLIILFTVFVIVRNKLYKQLFLILFWALPLLDWQIYKKTIHLENIYFEGHGLVFSGQKIIDSTVGTFRELINIKSWNFLWIVYFYSLIMTFTIKNKELLILHAVVLSQLGLYLILYFFTLGNDPASSIERLLVHIAPVALLTVAISTKKIFR